MLSLHHVSVAVEAAFQPDAPSHGGRTVLLSGVSWEVLPGQRWAVIGANGSGKSTLLRVASLHLYPSSGTVHVFGEKWGELDVRSLRPRIGLASAALAELLRPGLTARDVVMTARYGALETWWHTYTDHDRAHADAQLVRTGIGHFAGRALGTLSSGERQRVLLARVLMTDPGLVLLDEVSAGLDMVAREALVGALDALAADPTTAPLVLVTHHVEEIPPHFTHVLLLRDGEVLASGPIEATLTSEALSACLGLPVSVERRRGRWSAWPT